jgi:hypothetical protein
MAGDQGGHEPQRADPDGRLGARAGGRVLSEGAQDASRGAAIADRVFAEPSPEPHECTDALDGLKSALARLLQNVRDPACARLLGPIVPGAAMARGARVPGTSYELDPVKAAFDIGTLQRWSAADRSDLGTTDSLGALLAVMDYRSRRALAEAVPPPTVGDLLATMVLARDIERRLAHDAMFASPRPGHAGRVKIASAALACAALGGSRAAVIDAVSLAWRDGSEARAEDGDAFAEGRVGWRIGDATSRGVRLALLALAGGERTARVARWPPAGRVLALAPTAPVRGELEASVVAFFPAGQAQKICARFEDAGALAELPVHDLVALLVRN